MSESDPIELHVDRISSTADEALATIRKEKPEQEKKARLFEAVTASVDAFRYKTEDEIWKNNIIIEADFEPDENVFPYGTHVALIPDSASSDYRWGFTVTVTEGLKEPRLGGIMQVKGGSSPMGKSLVHNISTTTSEIDQKQLIHAVAGLAVKTLYNNARLKTP